MHWILAAATSLGFPNLDNKIDFALAYTSGLKERPSIRHLTLGTKNSFTQEKLLIALISTLWHLSQFLFQINSKIGTNPDMYPQIQLSHKLRKFNLNIPVYNHILIFILSSFSSPTSFLRSATLLPLFFQTSFQSIN